MTPPALSNIFHWLIGTAILFGCERLGTLASTMLALPVPGAVVGMLLLLFGLMVNGGVPRGLAQISAQLLFLLPLLFLPAAVGVFFLRDLAPADWLALIAAVVIGTLISLVLCAMLLQRLLNKAGSKW
ncbi:CidA/LrgA family protein [Microbulbifer sp. MLAF003]|uniref:CidA/LrgA family protein n=1 Tax=unclassified Microbulbifer TaxID=2619833 RepID=UPI0024AE62BC|nr:CidA/LrgA family protein [Microbulbifer sp. MLAF003]WHI51357.1 CidA/LrgA family protein [Microbulbifer sp. MLAF003]